MKNSILGRRRAAHLLASGGIGRLARAMPISAGIVILSYHRIAEEPTSLPDPHLWSATPAEFKRQLETLREHFDVISIDQLAEALNDNRGRRAMITFDDGYRDNYEHAFPALRAAGVPATFFLSTGFLDRPRLAWWDEIAWMIRRSQVADPEASIQAETDRYKALPAEQGEPFLDELAARTGSGRAPASEAERTWMTWEMIREMRDAGMGFGGHTVNHPVLARCSPEGQREEISTCLRRLEEELDDKVRQFSYPVGLPDCFDATARETLREQGIRFAFSNYGGYVRPDQDDPLDLQRTNVDGTMDLDLFSATLRWPGTFARW